MEQRNWGFTLMELLICMAIILILSTISYPLYSHHLIRIKRDRAAMALEQLAMRLEQYHSAHDTYEGVTSADLHIEDLITDKSYKLTVEKAAESQFLIQAVPSPQQQDPLCGTLGLDEQGNRFSDDKTTVEGCWRLE